MHIMHGRGEWCWHMEFKLSPGFFGSHLDRGAVMLHIVDNAASPLCVATLLFSRN